MRRKRRVLREVASVTMGASLTPPANPRFAYFRFEPCGHTEAKAWRMEHRVQQLAAALGSTRAKCNTCSVAAEDAEDGN